MGMPKALSYAEDQLGVHRTWAELQGVTVRLADLYRERAGFESETRSLDYQTEQRKNQILRDLYNTPTKEMSQAAQDRAYRLACAEDEQLASIQDMRIEAMSRRDSVNAEIYGAEQNHKAYVARLKELDGYFEYLAAVKQAETVANFHKTDWPY